MKKKERPVYSTDKAAEPEVKTEALLSEGPCKMRLEKKGRAGKSVTVLFNLPYTPSQAKTLMKQIQTFLGTGATFKNQTIEIRGDQRDKIKLYFQKMNLKIISAGG